MQQLTLQQRFLFDETAILAWAASVQRAKLYDSKIKPEDRNSVVFRAAVLQYIEKILIPKYKSACTEADHIANIESLVHYATVAGKEILGDSGYKFGVAQKLLNLLLKYLWCLGHIAEPPHCPIDRIILNKTALKDRLNWTQIVTAKQYGSAIAAIQTVASKQGLTLAQWELKFYARR